MYKESSINLQTISQGMEQSLQLRAQSHTGHSN